MTRATSARISAAFFRAVVVSPLLLLLLLVAPSPAVASEVGSPRTLGFGFAFGEPTSLVGKYFVGGGNAIDFGLSFWQLGSRCPDAPGTGGCRTFGYLGLFADYLWVDRLAEGTARLDWHFGPGLRTWIGESFALGGRMPIGVDLTFENPRFLEIFFEVSPALYVVPSLDLRIEVMLGARLYLPA